MNKFVIHSERGANHADNEDAALAFPHARDETLLLCTLADGQGSRSGGKEAAQTAARAVISLANALPASRLRNHITREWA